MLQRYYPMMRAPEVNGCPPVKKTRSVLGRPWIRSDLEQGLIVFLDAHFISVSHGFTVPCCPSRSSLSERTGDLTLSTHTRTANDVMNKRVHDAERYSTKLLFESGFEVCVFVCRLPFSIIFLVHHMHVVGWILDVFLLRQRDECSRCGVEGGRSKPYHLTHNAVCFARARPGPC